MHLSEPPAASHAAWGPRRPLCPFWDGFIYWSLFYKELWHKSLEGWKYGHQYGSQQYRLCLKWKINRNSSQGTDSRCTSLRRWPGPGRAGWTWRRVARCTDAPWTCPLPRTTWSSPSTLTTRSSRDIVVGCIPVLGDFDTDNFLRFCVYKCLRGWGVEIPFMF